MKRTIFKVLMLVLALSVSVQAIAMGDEQQVEYSTAITEGNLPLVKNYIEKGIAKVNEEFFGWTALENASNSGQIKVVEYLLDKGANPNHQHPISKNSAFHLAAFNNNAELVKVLAKRGVDVNLKLRGDVSILRAIRDMGNTQMVELLTSVGVKDDGCLEEKCN